jgi:hypothetical protein
MSQQDSRFISNLVLSSIREFSKTHGYPKAILKFVDLPDFDENKIKERVIWHYIMDCTPKTGEFFLKVL